MEPPTPGLGNDCSITETQLPHIMPKTFSWMIYQQLLTLQCAFSGFKHIIYQNLCHGWKLIALWHSIPNHSWSVGGGGKLRGRSTNFSALYPLPVHLLAGRWKEAVNHGNRKRHRIVSYPRPRVNAAWGKLVVDVINSNTVVSTSPLLCYKLHSVYGWRSYEVGMDATDWCLFSKYTKKNWVMFCKGKWACLS